MSKRHHQHQTPALSLVSFISFSSLQFFLFFSYCEHVIIQLNTLYMSDDISLILNNRAVFMKSLCNFKQQWQKERWASENENGQKFCCVYFIWNWQLQADMREKRSDVLIIIINILHWSHWMNLALLLTYSVNKKMQMRRFCCCCCVYVQYSMAAMNEGEIFLFLATMQMHLHSSI